MTIELQLIHLHMPKDLHMLLKEYAEKTELNNSQVIRRALKDFLAKQEDKADKTK